MLTIAVDRDLAGVPAGLAGFAAELKDPRHVVVRYQPSTAHVGMMLDALRSAGVNVVDVTTEEADLEDVFLRLTRGAPVAQAER